MQKREGGVFSFFLCRINLLAFLRLMPKDLNLYKSKPKYIIGAKTVIYYIAGQGSGK
jgi:hypothetical protein